MPKITNAITHQGVEIVNIEYEDGLFWSGLKSAYDEQQANTPTLEA